MLENTDPEDQDIELVSKTQLKRDSHDLQDFGKKLVALKPAQLETIQLPDSLFHAINEAKKILNKRSALKRQYQYIGKILRNIDLDEIQNRYSRLENQAEINNQRQHQCEYWRDQISELGDSALNEFLQTLTIGFDRQHFRQLARNIYNAKKETQKTTYKRQLFQLIYSTLKQQDGD